MQRCLCLSLSLLFVVLSGALVIDGPLARAHGQTLAARKDSVTQAETDFRLYCADCHGKDGRGQGPKTFELGRALPDLTTLTERNHGAFPREWLVRIIDGREYVQEHGTQEMPVWGRWLKMEAAEGLGGGDGDDSVVQRRVRDLVDLLEQWQR